jgi:hypothetical protein
VEKNFISLKGKPPSSFHMAIIQKILCVALVLFMAGCATTKPPEQPLRTLKKTDGKGISYVFMTNAIPGQVQALGPVLFVPPNTTSEASGVLSEEVAKKLAPQGFNYVRAKFYDKEAREDVLGKSGMQSRILYAGTWDSFVALNKENSEKDGKEFDPKGFLGMAGQVLVMGVGLLAGVPVTATTMYGMGAQYGNFSKEDTSWFQSIQIDPGLLAKPPNNVIAIKTSADTFYNKDRVALWTLVLTNQEMDKQEALMPVIAKEIAANLSLLMKPKAPISDADREAIARIEDRLKAKNASINETAKLYPQLPPPQ